MQGPELRRLYPNHSQQAAKVLRLTWKTLTFALGILQNRILNIIAYLYTPAQNSMGVGLYQGH